MKIELKNIEYSPALSEETIAFAANLYINGVHAGFASNRGHGGSTDYYHKDERGRALIKDAEAYCQTLPPIQFPADEYMEGFKIDSTLENHIDRLLSQWVDEKESARFRKALSKAMQQGIVFGTPDQEFRTIKFKRPIDELLRLPNGQAAIVNVLRSKIVPTLWEQDLILNTNIPEVLFDEAGIPPERLVTHSSDGPKNSEERDKGRGR